jgi:DNA polymerase III subunit chi
VPAVSFHFNVDDRVGYAARLLRKAHRAGARLTVVGQPAVLDRLDPLLWTAFALDFVPHVRLRSAAPVPAVAAATPILLCDDPDGGPSRPMLVNLTDDLPRHPGQYERIIEIVPRDPSALQLARDRWKWYRDQDCDLDAHDAAAGD